MFPGKKPTQKLYFLLCIINQNWSVLSDDRPGQAGKVGDGMTIKTKAPMLSQDLRLTMVHHLGLVMLPGKEYRQNRYCVWN